MEKRKLVVGLAAVITTAAETGKDGLPVPKGPMYLAMMGQGYDLEGFNILMAVLTENGLARVTAETVTLTAKGLAMAADLEAAIKKAGRS